MNSTPLHSPAGVPILPELGNICRKYRVRELAAFGSAARGNGRPDSDIDLYVEFEQGYHPGLAWFDLEEDLESMFGRPVDITRKSLLKPGVLREALRDTVLLYAA
jgi:predicted nucleotidyltransferase